VKLHLKQYAIPIVPGLAGCTQNERYSISINPPVMLLTMPFQHIVAVCVARKNTRQFVTNKRSRRAANAVPARR
jgi:hypothetical protein